MAWYFKLGDVYIYIYHSVIQWFVQSVRASDPEWPIQKRARNEYSGYIIYLYSYMCVCSVSYYMCKKRHVSQAKQNSHHNDDDDEEDNDNGAADDDDTAEGVDDDDDVDDDDADVDADVIMRTMLIMILMVIVMSIVMMACL